MTTTATSKSQERREFIPRQTPRRETVVDALYYEEPDEEEIRGFFRTREKHIAAFLKARGFTIRGIEKVLFPVSKGQTKHIVVFCFDGGNVTRRAILEYYNTDDPATHNVNAKRILAEFNNITSMISNF